MSDVPYLFKYIPYRQEFFENFYLRCTPRSALNDPFELRPSDDYRFDQKIQLFGRGHIEGAFTEDAAHNDKWMRNTLDGLFNKIGIVSFSETNDNLLMWSHYADNHRGIVVAFDTSHDFFKKDGSKSRELGRVHYRKDRMKALPQRFKNGFHMSDSTRIYFEKSDEWIYEKEHRLISDLYAVDATLCTPAYYDKRLRHKHPGYEPKAVSHKLVSISDIENSCHDAAEPSVLCMLKVPPDCILSVTCGSNMPKAQRQEIRQHAQRLGYSYYEAVPDSDEYRLNLIQPE